MVGARPATAPLAASPSTSRSVMCVACTTHQRSSTFACVEQPFDRPHAAPRVALVDFARLLGGVDVDRRARRRDAHDLPELLRRHGAQAVRRDAEHVAVPPRASRERLDEPRERVGECTKRRWPAVGGAPPKPPCA